jgi:hypothetical protein
MNLARSNVAVGVMLVFLVKAPAKKDFKFEYSLEISNISELVLQESIFGEVIIVP